MSNLKLNIKDAKRSSKMGICGESDSDEMGMSGGSTDSNSPEIREKKHLQAPKKLKQHITLN